MGETDLSEIESRIGTYPPQARHDILRLTCELRQFYADDSRKKRAQSPLYDALTGLLNGGAYGVRFAMARARATRYRKIFAVMSIDVVLPRQTGSKKAVDEPAHAQVIKEVAERLEACMRATDTLARIGDQSFAIILEDLTESSHAERVKQNVENALAGPMRIEGRETVADAMVRLQFYPEARRDGTSGIQLIG